MTVLNSEVEKTFTELLENGTKMLSGSAGPQSVDAVCQYVTSTLTNRSKGFLSMLITRLMRDALEKPALSGNLEAVNQLYELDLQGDIMKRYHFECSVSLTPAQARSELSQLAPSAAALAIGGVLCFVLVPVGARIAVLSVAVVIAAGLYWFSARVKGEADRKSVHDELEKALYQTKAELYQWFEGVEGYFNGRMDKWMRETGIDGNRQ